MVPTIGNVRYHDAATGRPSSTKTLTDASGTAWVFDIPPGTVSFAVGGPANEFGGRSITVGSRVCAQLTIVAT